MNRVLNKYLSFFFSIQIHYMTTYENNSCFLLYFHESIPRGYELFKFKKYKKKRKFYYYSVVSFFKENPCVWKKLALLCVCLLLIYGYLSRYLPFHFSIWVIKFISFDWFFLLLHIQKYTYLFAYLNSMRPALFLIKFSLLFSQICKKIP